MMYNVARNKVTNNRQEDTKMTRTEERICKNIRICKRIYDNAKNYNLAQNIESKLTYISILNTNLEFLVDIGSIIRYDINRDKNDNEKITKIVLLFEGLGTINITVD